MSAQATNEWKVGAFIVGGVVLLILTLFWLGATRLNIETVDRVTYFDESVQGLEVGAPIKFRGVTIGKVSKIVIAPDRRLVQVEFQAHEEELSKAGETHSQDPQKPTELRIVVSTTGITGVKYLEADFFPADSPSIALTFDAPDNYMPSAPSTLKSLEDALRGLGEELPLAFSDFHKLTIRLVEKLESTDTAALAASFTELADEIRSVLNGTSESGLGPDLHGLVSDLRSTLQGIDSAVVALTTEGGTLPSLASSIDGISSDLHSTLGKVDTVLDGADVASTLAAVRSAANSAARLADGLGPAGEAAPELIHDLRAMVRKIQSLAALIERDPGVFLRGR